MSSAELRLRVANKCRRHLALCAHDLQQPTDWGTWRRAEATYLCFLQVGLGAMRDGKRIGHRSGLSCDAPLRVFPGVTSGRIGRIAFRIFGEDFVVPRRRLCRIGVARDFVPELFHQQKFFGRGEPGDLSGEGGVHARHDANGRSGGKFAGGWAPRIAWELRFSVGGHKKHKKRKRRNVRKT